MNRLRRANAHEGARPLRVNLRVSVDEMARLRAEAEDQRATVPRLIMSRALAPQGQVGNLEHRRELAGRLMRVERQIAGIANNVNQIARATNATREVQPDTAAALRAATASMTRIEDAVRELTA